VPAASVIVGLPEITIEVMVAFVTVSDVLPLTVPSDDVAVIVVADELTVKAVTSPPVVIEAIVGVDDIHVTDDVRSFVDISL
jgi:hypothetical protein